MKQEEHPLWPFSEQVSHMQAWQELDGSLGAEGATSSQSDITAGCIITPAWLLWSPQEIPPSPKKGKQIKFKNLDLRDFILLKCIKNWKKSCISCEELTQDIKVWHRKIILKVERIDQTLTEILSL